MKTIVIFSIALLLPLIASAQSIIMQDPAGGMRTTRGVTTGLVDSDNILDDSILINDLNSALRTGNDSTLVTGTSGATGNCSEWDANGDLVDAGAPCGSGAGLFTDLGIITHLISTTDNLIIGGTSDVAGTVVAEATGNFKADTIETRQDADGDQLILREGTGQGAGTGAISLDLNGVNLPDGTTRQCLDNSGFIRTSCLDNSMKTSSVGFEFFASSGTIQAGWQAMAILPFPATITAARARCTPSGDAVADVWSSSVVPTDANSITGAAPITISSGTLSDDTTLTGWSTSIPSGNTLIVNIDSATTVTLCYFHLELLKTDS